MKRGSGIWAISAILILLVQGIAFTAHGTTYHITDLGEGAVGGLNELGQITGVSGGRAYIYDSGVFSWIDPPGPGSISPIDINIDGKLVGSYNNVFTNVFLFDGSESIDLGRFGGEIAYGQAINASGQIVGAYKPSGSGMKAFFYSNGYFKDLGLLGTTGYSIATAINSHGKITGQSTGISGVDRAFYYDGSTMHDLGTLGFEPSSRRSYGTDINDAGHVVGWAHDLSYRYRAFLWDGNQMNDIGSLGVSSRAYAINSADVVVGSFALNSTGTEHAFVHDGTQMLDLNDLLIDGTGWVLTEAIDINSNGWIVGYGDLDGVQHCFLLTPEDDSVIPTVIEVAVETDNGRLLDGIKVYAFTSSGSYTGQSATTDETGTAQFNLQDFQDGIYQFRVDYLQQQFWSNSIYVPDEFSVSVNIDEADVPVYVTTGSNPLEGIKLYLFSGSGAYLGINGVTDQNGSVNYLLPVGMDVKFRADYLGYQFWTEAIEVMENDQVSLMIPHELVAMSVQGVYQGAVNSLAGLNVYLFKPSGAYLGTKEITDANGQVFFSLPEQPYRARADYLGQQFWSDDFVWTDTVITVPMAEAEVSVVSGNQPVQDAAVFVFSESESYLGINGISNANGKVSFRLPAGNYRFRADYQQNQYWSDTEILIADLVNPLAINTGGGMFDLSVLADVNTPLTGVDCYVFNDSGVYLGMSSTTNNAGQVSFDLADGAYKFRVDYLGYQFWSDEYAVPGVFSAEVAVPHQDVGFTVNSLFQEQSTPVENATVYLFTSSGSYMNSHLASDADGRVIFNLPERAYKVRVDYLGQQYWSEESIWQETSVSIPMGDAEINVVGAQASLPNVPVYVFSGPNAYLGISGKTDSEGNLTFRLPSGIYRFRADYQGSQYWSEEITLVAGQPNAVEISTGGGQFQLTVLKDISDPLVGVNCYFFGEQGNYLGLHQTTDSNGQIGAGLADGRYKIRVDYLGHQFWTNVFEVPETLVEQFTIPHSMVTLGIEGLYPASHPIEGVKVYLFTTAGSYLNLSQTTNADGQVSFSLPDQEYKARADYLGLQFWSNEFQSENTTVSIDEGMARVQVRRSGSNQEGARVYVFSEAGSYLGKTAVTEADGNAEFILPSASFQFRADQGGDQVWSGVMEILPAVVNDVIIELD